MIKLEKATIDKIHVIDCSFFDYFGAVTYTFRKVL